jgi:CubicO group peptidase (beta-lactamase class C family)
MRKAFTAGVAILLLGVASTGWADADDPSDRLVAWITENMQSRDTRFPGVSVAVLRNFQIAWARGFGFADRVRKIPVDEHTTFQAASVSKAVTAVAAMIAFTAHGLQIDADINNVFRTFPPEPSVGFWTLPNPSFPDTPVTLRLLLSHTAGANTFRYSGYRHSYYEDPPDPIDPIPTMRQELLGLPPANTPAIHVFTRPGQYWAYSPAGYTVIQAALMNIYREPFADVMQRLILTPLGMRESSFVQPTPRRLVPRLAVPYMPDDKPPFNKPLPYGPLVFDTASSGGLTTTPSDLARFVIAVQNALRSSTQEPIAPQIAREMMVRQPGVIADPKDCLDPDGKTCQSSWGLGFDVNIDKYYQHQADGTPTGAYFGHTGFNSGYLSMMIGSKTKGNGAVIMVNMAPLDMSGPVPQGVFLSNLMRQIADEEGWQ